VNYGINELKKTLESIRTANHEGIFISGNLARLGKGNFDSKEKQLHGLIEALKSSFGNEVNIMTSTFSHDLIHSKKVYDRKITPSMHGAIANHFISLPESVRSHHPFSSFCAIGPDAEYLCGRNLPHAYGPLSPYDRLLSLRNPITISIGTEPRLSGSIVHHAEFMAHVPYRYIKEFLHPISIDNQLIHKKYYMHVTYLNADLERDRNKKIFEKIYHEYIILKKSLGKGYIYAYNTKEIYDSMLHQMLDDPYVWLKKEPLIKPFLN
jgi:aminoglycoside 3-N-acetyltransferase